MKETFENKYKSSLNNIKKQQELLEAAKGGKNKKKGAMDLLREQEKEAKKNPVATAGTGPGVVSGIKLSDIEQLFKGLNTQIEKVSNEQN